MSVGRHRALLLDRDGVINHDAGYTSSADNFHFIDGIFELCRAASRSGYLLIVITNQAGIGRGYYSEEDFAALTRWMGEVFVKEGAPISGVFHCPFHPEHGVGIYRKDSFDRKPHPGMLLRAAEQFDLDLVNSIMIGDKDSDMQAAVNAGVSTRCHFLPDRDQEPMSASATHRIASLPQALAFFRTGIAVKQNGVSC
ncbi:HAD family hydrolase [Herbaspirillum sp. RTI4]|uniref:D-glycero-alpha-D-manno-heptose-1,7-bisphosphate 7-phosphatase n=1 Tax=Herbaspirillum sp. RTI4 TaxID=3048640 RepID=UPI002AB35C00|nr:HAD family hydrolase [Herbaspirillum sp. RTI4]MDY7579607.1 HAD family hydrolase [Herbaspirillum sp. RTI4]MEA9981764.1 HAD family hydrolase [Herbaspirillum sp. RTI4]